MLLTFIDTSNRKVCMTAGAKTKLQVDGVISIRLPSATATSHKQHNSLSFVAQETAMIFNSPFEYDVI